VNIPIVARLHSAGCEVATPTSIVTFEPTTTDADGRFRLDLRVRPGALPQDGGDFFKYCTTVTAFGSASTDTAVVVMPNLAYRHRGATDSTRVNFRLP
jgi:hypothetical protein